MAIELSEFNIKYIPHTTNKVQVLADFLAKSSIEEISNKEESRWTLGSLLQQK